MLPQSIDNFIVAPIDGKRTFFYFVSILIQICVFQGLRPIINNGRGADGKPGVNQVRLNLVCLVVILAYLF
jgi:hypothetical protein